MTIYSLQKELDRVKEDLIKMARLLEDQIYKSIKSLVDKDIELAREVVKNDDIIDDMEIRIEKKCMCLVALKQPLAKDLRLIAAILRNIVDIERMADHAEEIAKVAIELHDQIYIKPLIDIPKMGDIGQEMVRIALKAFIEEDFSVAKKLIDLEREMDHLYSLVFNELLSFMIKDAKNIAQATSLLLVAGHLERIGDHATNIGEMVLYITHGKRLDLNEIARDHNY